MNRKPRRLAQGVAAAGVAAASMLGAASAAGAAPAPAPTAVKLDPSVIDGVLARYRPCEWKVFPYGIPYCPDQTIDLTKVALPPDVVLGPGGDGFPYGVPAIDVIGGGPAR